MGKFSGLLCPFSPSQVGVKLATEDELEEAEMHSRRIDDRLLRHFEKDVQSNAVAYRFPNILSQRIESILREAYTRSGWGVSFAIDGMVQPPASVMVLTASLLPPVESPT